MNRLLGGLCLALVSLSASAELETSGDGTVTQVLSYSEYGNGDIVFSLSTPGTLCSTGYWLRKADAGFQANLTMLIAAYQAKGKIAVIGQTDQLWAGSSNKYCHVYSIEYRP